MLAGEGDCRDDVGQAGAADDERRPFINHAVPDLAGLLVPLIAGKEHFTLHPVLQVVHSGCAEHHWCARERNYFYLGHELPPSFTSEVAAPSSSGGLKA